MTYKVLAAILLASSLAAPKTVHGDGTSHSYYKPSKAVVTARLWGKNKKPSPTDLELHLRVQNLVNTFKMRPKNVEMINVSIKSVALYRYIDVGRYRLQPKLYNLVEDTLTGKMLAAKSFTVKECLECDPEKLVIRERMLPLIGGTDLSIRLEEIAERVRVDGFLLWNIYREKEQLFLSVAIVNAKYGSVVWKRRFSESMVPFKVIAKPESKYEKIFTVGAWGHKVSRTYKTTEMKTSEDIIGAVSFRVRRDAKDNRNFIFGVGGGYFKNVVTKDDTDLSGFTVYGHLNYKLDRRLFGEPAAPVAPVAPAAPDETAETVPAEPAPPETLTDPENTEATADSTADSIQTTKRLPKYVSKYNLYLDLGQAFFMNNQTEFVKTGFEIRTAGGIVIDIGAVYLPKTESIMTVPSGYNPTVSFGGTSYALSLGYLF